ncbi:N-acetylmuramic acid 6-phosphate etherase [Caldalkalibacillus uzonensis]|uniref:N-acetylmuramic acid 6-phosphate etherase n=1 Tax=Caldalkalibacillus uzonensis TaxID=353224 RepID=A0ABU0CV99_9BACI|nr:N-acetylmuramic acid 6-phosphate etherase [Caldalkalibacillus uzonensis]MDQ0340023.1 N-acetylmuramic acid 6-phosphate etherase [Caldalkalibacillus uzonensis]
MEFNLSNLTTEQRNKHSLQIDKMTTYEILTIMNSEDSSIAPAVRRVLPQIERAVELTYEALNRGGRLFYIGAGTSGRLGVLDAAECPPTFSVDEQLVQAVIAGGPTAMYKAVEGAEDDGEEAVNALLERGLSAQDVVIGITASGRTPFVIEGLKYTRQRKACTIALTCNKQALVSQYADHTIEVVVGPEVLAGSTRLKAATAQKMVLNMISTAAMIKLGKVYENLMVDLHASNRKLRERARRILMAITGVTYEEAVLVLEQTQQEVKPAIVMIKTGCTYQQAVESLQQSKGFVREAITRLLHF